MPTFDFECPKCFKVEELFNQKLEQPPFPVCPKCRCKMKRLFNQAPAVLGVADWTPYYDYGLGIQVNRMADIDARIAALRRPRPYKAQDPATGEVKELEIPGQNIVNVGKVHGSKIEPDDIERGYNEHVKKTQRAMGEAVLHGIAQQPEVQRAIRAAEKQNARKRK